MAKRKKKSTANSTANRAQAARSPQTGQDRLPGWLAASALALAIGVVYGPAFAAPFIFDDQIAIVTNDSIVSLWPLLGTSAHPGPLNPSPGLPTTARPLVNLSFALNYHFGKLDPTGYHAANALIHFCSALLLRAIVRITLRLPYFAGQFDRSAGWLALAVAMLWALHPLATEAVIYATQRTELMMASFYLATLYCSLRYWQAPRPGLRAAWLVLATLACAGGMASKEVMVSAPLVVLLFERAFVAGSLAAALRRSWRLYACLASTWLILLALGISAPHSHSAGFDVGVPAAAWWMTQCHVLLMYLKLVVWPWPLLIHYQMPYVTTLAYVVPVVLLALATLELLRRNHAAGFLGTCVFAILSPTFVIPIVTETAAERRMYLPLAALVALFVARGYWLASRVVSTQGTAAERSNPMYRLATAVFVVAGIAIAFGLVSANRLEAYRDEMGLWQQVLALQPDDSIAHENVAYLLNMRGDTAGAIDEYREAVRLKPDSAQGQYTLGLLLHQLGSHGEAADHFAVAARVLPENATIRNNLAVALYMAGRNDQAIAAFRQTVELDRQNWTAYKNLGMALQKEGRLPEAIESYRHALELNPAALNVYDDLAKAYARQNQPDEALAALRHALQLAQAAGDIENTKKFNARLIETR